VRCYSSSWLWLAANAHIRPIRNTVTPDNAQHTTDLVRQLDKHQPKERIIPAIPIPPLILQSNNHFQHPPSQALSFALTRSSDWILVILKNSMELAIFARSRWILIHKSMAKNASFSLFAS
jgi:hypothetical protein